MNVLSNFLKGCKVLDVIASIAGLLEESGVYDDAVALLAVTD